MPRLRALASLTLVSSLFLLAGCSGPAAHVDEEGPDSNLVVMKNMAYSPKTLKISVGETVTWVNQDSMGHTVSADDPAQWGTPGSGDPSDQWMMKGDTWSHTFTEPGTYHYYCKPHASGSMGNRQGMVGTVIVEA